MFGLQPSPSHVFVSLLSSLWPPTDRIAARITTVRLYEPARVANGGRRPPAPTLLRQLAAASLNMWRFLPLSAGAGLLFLSEDPGGGPPPRAGPGMGFRNLGNALSCPHFLGVSHPHWVGGPPPPRVVLNRSLAGALLLQGKDPRSHPPQVQHVVVAFVRPGCGALPLRRCRLPAVRFGADSSPPVVGHDLLGGDFGVVSGLGF